MNFLRKSSRGSAPTIHFRRADSKPAVTGIVVGEDALEVDPEYAAYEDQISMEEELASLNSDHSCSSSEGAAVPLSLSLSLSRQNLTRMVSKSKVVLSSATSLAVKGLMKGASKTKVFAQNLRARRQSGQQQQSGLLASTGPECGSGELGCSEGEADEEDEEEVIVDSRASSSRARRADERGPLLPQAPLDEELLPQDPDFLSFM